MIRQSKSKHTRKNVDQRSGEGRERGRREEKEKRREMLIKDEDKKGKTWTERDSIKKNGE